MYELALPCLDWTAAMHCTSQDLVNRVLCSIDSRWGRVLARLQLSCTPFFTAYALSPHVALALNMLQRSAHHSRVALYRRLGVQVHCYRLRASGGSSSPSHPVLFSPVVYSSLPRYHCTMEPGLLLSKARVGGYPMLWHGGLSSIDSIK